MMSSAGLSSSISWIRVTSPVRPGIVVDPWDHVWSYLDICAKTPRSNPTSYDSDCSMKGSLRIAAHRVAVPIGKDRPFHWSSITSMVTTKTTGSVISGYCVRIAMLRPPPTEGDEKPGLSSGLPPVTREVSPNLTPFTQEFPACVLKLLKSLVSTSFTTRADGRSIAECVEKQGVRRFCLIWFPPSLRRTKKRLCSVWLAC